MTFNSSFNQKRASTLGLRIPFPTEKLFNCFEVFHEEPLCAKTALISVPRRRVARPYAGIPPGQVQTILFSGFATVSVPVRVVSHSSRVAL
jgi:hypothetical protein